MIAGWFAKTDWTAAHPEQVAAFRRAIDKASTYITAHPTEMPAILTRFTKLSKETAAHIALPAFATGLNLAALQQAINLTAAHDFIPQSFPARELLAPGLAWPQ